MAGRVLASDEELERRMATVVNACKQVCGRRDEGLAEVLNRDYALEVTYYDISKWRKAIKHRRVPKEPEAEALAGILRRPEAASLLGREEADRLATDVFACRTQLIRALQRPSTVTLDDFVTQTRADLVEATRSGRRSWLSPDTLFLLWEALSGDFSSVLSSPSRMVQDLTYEIQIVWKGGQWHVTTKNRGQRLFPGVDAVFVSYCSTSLGLDHEYGQQELGCIARELVECDGDEDFGAWAARVRSKVCKVRVGARDCDETDGAQVEDQASGFIVRRYFDVRGTTLGERLTTTTIRTQFELPGAVDQFPIHFTSYYCLGTTTIELDITRPGCDLALDFSSFLPLSSSAPLSRSTDEPGHIELVTTERTVLAPGSGVYVRWSESVSEA